VLAVDTFVYINLFGVCQNKITTINKARYMKLHRILETAQIKVRCILHNIKSYAQT